MPTREQTRAPFGTPPMQHPLYETFTGSHREESLFALLEGRYKIPPSLDQPTQHFLGQCRFHQEDFSPASMELTPDDHQRFWTKNKENKGSEPHGLHNGHFKAALGSPLISHCDSIFRSIPLTTGCVPELWKNLMNFAIEKKPGDHRLSKMRTIQLMNSEFQANNKKMGKTAMALAEEHQLIPAGQCGARKQHQAIDLVLSKCLVWDLLILQRRSAGWISNDAKSCFDRIVHWVAVVSLLRFGIIYSVGQGEGNKILQARIRMASDSPPDEIEHALDELFSETGFNMGIYKSPLQSATATRIGWLLNYPICVDLDELAREIMRLFRFEIAIALEAAFPINPTSVGKNFKRGGRKAIHIFTPSGRASEVVQRLLSAFSKDTTKHDMPFGASTRFVYDWKAVRSRSIGVEADAEISDFITQMITTHENFGASTCLIRPNFSMRLLEQNRVDLFGEDISLLRIIYAILCTPRQGALATAKKDVDLGDPTTTTTEDEVENGAAAAAAAAAEDEVAEAATAAEGSPSDASHHSGSDGAPSPPPPPPPSKTEERAPESPSGNTPKTRADTDSAEDTAPTTADESQPSSPSIPSPPKIHNKAKLPDTTSQQVSSLTQTPIIVDSSQAPTETEEEKRVRLCKKDLESVTPAPLFVLSLPSSIKGSAVLVARNKNRHLAQNVITGFAAFLVYHLDLGDKSPKELRRYLKVWLGKQHLSRIAEYGMVWDPVTLQAQSEFDRTRTMDIDEDDDWLEALDDTREMQKLFDGTLTIDLELSSVKMLDDGTTVASRLRAKFYVSNRLPSNTASNNWSWPKRTGRLPSCRPDWKPSQSPKSNITLPLLKPIPEMAPPEMMINHRRSEAARLRRASRCRLNRNPSDQVAHSLIEDFLNSCPSGNFFGDNSSSHPPRSTRILFQNVHCIPLRMREEKQNGLFQCWKDENVGISLLAEMNLNWASVPSGQKWFDRVRQGGKQRGHYSAVAHNSHQEIPSPSAFQWGGCSATLLNDVSHSARSAGSDSTGLGRWAWVKLRGRCTPASTNRAEEQIDSVAQDLVVISAYRPNKQSANSSSVWNLQRNYWLGKGLDVDPREKFTTNLSECVKQWLSDGCEVILGIDANEDVSANHPGSFRQHMRECGLSEAILSRHHGPYPATQHSNQTNTPIDGIFASSGVWVLSGGYLDFHQYF